MKEKRADVEDEGESESDHGIYCVVCGHHCLIKNAIKHMDKSVISLAAQCYFGFILLKKLTLMMIKETIKIVSIFHRVGYDRLLPRDESMK